MKNKLYKCWWLDPVLTYDVSMAVHKGPVIIVRPLLVRYCTIISASSLIYFHILVWVLTESRIPLKPVLGDVRIVAFSIGSHEQTQ